MLQFRVSTVASSDWPGWKDLIAYSNVIIRVLLEGEKYASNVGVRLTMDTADILPYIAVVELVTQPKNMIAFQNMRPLCGLLPRFAKAI